MKTIIYGILAHLWSLLPGKKGEGLAHRCAREAIGEEIMGDYTRVMQLPEPTNVREVAAQLDDPAWDLLAIAGKIRERRLALNFALSPFTYVPDWLEEMQQEVAREASRRARAGIALCEAVIQNPQKA